MSEEAQPAGSTSSEDPLVVFEYIKSAYFRVIHADGAIGAITPHGNIHFALFSDRPAIPKMQVMRQNPDGSLGEVLNDRTIVRPGLIREMDVDVVLSPATARGLADWLYASLAQLEALQSKKAES